MADQAPDPYGMADALPEGCIPLGITGIIKALDADGDTVIVTYRQPGITAWEALGMLIAAADDMRASLQRVEEG
ncbi:hypothetical protein ABT093_09720 [Kitasatospora sp. NPDC002551]|uniref:hypothetical protein n=1 Tax=Kitasatospora sp. NPDC002551 TaxID=3154539 RepID=UPI0033292C20